MIYNLPKIQVDLTLSESIQADQVTRACISILQLRIHFECFLSMNVCFQDENDVSIAPIDIDLKFPIVVKATSEYVIQVKLTQLNKNKDLKVHAPRFPKPKDESWFLVLGMIKYKELIALKRFTFGRRKEVFHNFIYQVPNTTGKLFAQYSVFKICKFCRATWC